MPGEQSCRMANMGVMCAFLIVLLHAGFRGVTMIAVPFFFLASGYFLAAHIGEGGWWRHEVGKRWRSLVIPLWLWGGIGLVFALIVQFGVDLFGYQLHGEAVSWTSRLFAATGFNFTANMGPLWFVRTLFVFVVISPVLTGGCMPVQSLRVLLFGVAYAAFETIGMAHGQLWHFFEYGLSLRGLLYFTIGIFLRQNQVRINFPRWSVGMLVLVSGGLVVCRASVLVLVPVAMCTMYLIMPSGKTYLYGYAFPIYLMHMMFLSITSIIMAMCGLRTSTCHSLVIGAARAVFAIAGSIAVTFLMRKYVPRVAKIAFGGR